MRVVEGPWYAVRRDLEGAPYISADLGPCCLMSYDVKDCIPRLASSVDELARRYVKDNTGVQGELLHGGLMIIR